MHVLDCDRDPELRFDFFHESMVVRVTRGDIWLGRWHEIFIFIPLFLGIVAIAGINGFLTSKWGISSSGFPQDSQEILEYSDSYYL